MYAFSGFSIQTDSIKGRKVVASKSFSAGDLVVKSPPFAAILQSDKWPTHCFFCFKASESVTLSKCSACKCPRYCSRDCQRKDWADHKVECEGIKRVVPRVPTTNMLLMARVLRRIVKESNIKPSHPMENVGPNVPAFPSHLSEHSAEQTESFAQMVVLVRYMMGLGPSEAPSDSAEPAFSLPYIVEMFARFNCNNFTITSPDLQPLGSAFYIAGAMFNHSCDPNCSVVYEGTSQIIRAIRKVSPGEELTVSYVDLAPSSLDRRQELKSSYFFTCHCLACLNSAEIDRRKDAYRCQCSGVLEATILTESQEDREAEEGGQVSSYTCDKCGQVASQQTMSGIRSTLERVALLRDRAAQTQDNSPKASLLSEAHTLASSVLSPASPLLLTLRSDLFSCLLDLGRFEDALPVCELALESHKACYPPMSALIGVQHFLLAKLYWYVERSVPALKEFTAALSILSVTHGPDHSLVQELLLRQDEARAQVAAEKSTGGRHGASSSARPQNMLGSTSRAPANDTASLSSSAATSFTEVEDEDEDEGDLLRDWRNAGFMSKRSTPK